MLDKGFHLMDCMDGMREFDDGCIDLIITSPPYNIGNEHHTRSKRFVAYGSHNDEMNEDDYQAWQENFLNECFRILKQDGSMFYNHKNRIKDGLQISPYEWILKSKLLVKQELVWFNGSPNFDKIRFYPITERVYWLVKDNKTQLINTINHHDVFDWPAVGSSGQHKRAFPEKMVQDILRCFPDKKTVLDPFSGSGTVGVVAHRMGFEYWGFELDADYHKAASEHLAKEKEMQPLFAPQEIYKQEGLTFDT